jgi:hypothetical protein
MIICAIATQNTSYLIVFLIGFLPIASSRVSQIPGGLSRVREKEKRVLENSFTGKPTGLGSRVTVLRVWKWGSLMVSSTSRISPGFKCFKDLP